MVTEDMTIGSLMRTSACQGLSLIHISQDVPAGSVLEDIARAAGGVLSDAGAKVKEVVTGTAEKAGVDTCLLYTSRCV